MAYRVESLYNAMLRVFKSQPANDRFKADFISAVNLSLDQLTFYAQLATALPHVTSETGTISALDPDDEAIVSDGVTFHLIRTGYEHAEGPNAYDRFLNRWLSSQGDFVVKKSREDQEAQDDNGVPTDVDIGLGYLGDG